MTTLFGCHLFWMSFISLLPLFLSRDRKIPSEREEFRAKILEYKALLHRGLLTRLFLVTLGPFGGDPGRRGCHPGGQPSVPTL